MRFELRTITGAQRVALRNALRNMNHKSITNGEAAFTLCVKYKH
jgi:hypothetical protein